MAGHSTILFALGAQIKRHRKRRMISEKLMATWAGIARSTLQLIERGSPGVSMGSYMAVMLQLDFEQDLIELGMDDIAGWRVQEQRMRRNQRKKLGLVK